MKRNRSVPPAQVIPVLVYPDVREAVAWLEAAFGASERVRIGDGHRAQISLNGAAVIVAETGNTRVAPSGGVTTHMVMLRVDDADAVCERAREHGARILMEPTSFEFGERQCELEDPFGQRWSITQTVADVAPEEWGGVTVNGGHDYPGEG
jgi:uncharacterized glyoxalase superfamily protein PhnB